MTDESFWDSPADQPVARHGEGRLTVVRAPFPGPEGILPAHDAQRAGEFTEAFGTIDAVLEDLGAVTATEAIPMDTRADLDRVRVGCWGNVTEICDPALANTPGMFSVDAHVHALAERFPDAVIIASATIDHNPRYGAWSILHPSGLDVFAEFWHDEGDWQIDGEPADVIDVFGIDPAHAEAEGIEANAAPETINWENLARLACARVYPIDRRGMTASVFRVRHTKEVTREMEETWIERR